MDLQVAQGEDQIPVSALHVRDRLNRALAKLRVGQAKIFLCDLNALAILIEA